MKRIVEKNKGESACEIVRNGEAYRAAQEERRKVWEEYRQERKARKEREQSLLEEVKSI